VPSEELIRRLTTLAPVPDVAELGSADRDAVVREVLAQMAADPNPSAPPAAYQDFITRCRMRSVPQPLDRAGFAHRFALARAGIVDPDDWEEVFALGAALPSEMLAPFLALARAARNGAPCPSDAELARLYGTSSPGRVRSMLGHIEEKGLIVCRTDLGGKRTIGLPHLGWTTAASVPDPGRPSRLARIADRPARVSARG